MTDELKAMNNFSIQRKISLRGLLIFFVSALVMAATLAYLGHLIFVCQYGNGWRLEAGQRMLRKIHLLYVFSGLLLMMLIVLVQYFCHGRKISRGVHLIKAHQYEEAIAFFEGRYQFYTKYSFWDQYRFGLLVSTSAISLRSIALKNIAACYVYLKNNEKANFYYKTYLAMKEGKEVTLPFFDKYFK